MHPHTHTPAHPHTRTLAHSHTRTLAHITHAPALQVSRFNTKHVEGLLSSVDDTHMYLVGWTLIPVNMMNLKKEVGKGRAAFLPVDALDCAGFRGRGQGDYLTV